MNRVELLTEIDACFEKSKLLKTFVAKYPKIIVLGNGRGSSVASSVCGDYTERLSKQAFTFTDIVALTANLNQGSVLNAYTDFLKAFADKDTLVILLCATGTSENLYRCVMECAERYLPTVIMTGQGGNNRISNFDFPSRLLNFWVNSADTTIVNLVHYTFLQSILDNP